MAKLTQEYNLEVINPSLTEQWHPIKNGSLTQKDVFPKSGKKVWWICDKGHEWESAISNRSNGSGCPYCSGREVCKDNCLETVNSALAKQWHPTKNGSLTPRDVAPGSPKKVWWICEKGHEWEASLNGRSAGRGCPYCAGNKVCSDNCLETLNPALAKQWHPKKNGNLTPKDVTAHSGRIVWWICEKGHEWRAVVGDRTNGNRCPYCMSKAVCDDNCLEIINPVLAQQWHPTKNGSLTPGDVFPNSYEKVWWICDRGHEWEAFVQARNHGTGCPYCSGKLVCDDNCLQTVNPGLAGEWHPTKNGGLTPRDVTPGLASAHP